VKRWLAGWRAGVVVVMATLAAVLLIRAQVAETVRISSDSMAPALNRDEKVLLDKLTPRLGRMDRGDLVAFASPQDGELVLKRVVGLGGDTVEIRDAVLFVNGGQVVEHGVDLAAFDATYFGPVSVPPGELFVLGDNRVGSVDSRAYGGVPVRAVTGRVVWRLP
jgi:signal peptidase I